MINKKIINKIKDKVAKEFPEFKDVDPKITEKVVRPQHSILRKMSLGIPPKKHKIFRMTFKKTVKAADNTALPRILYVTLKENGDIIKITGSK
jgi:hypothetical protein